MSVPAAVVPHSHCYIIFFSIVSAVTNNIALNISVHVSWCVDTRVFLGMCLETEISGGHFSGCQWEQARVEESC